jgi:rhamnosyltransferase
MKISVVVLTKNNQKLIGKCIKSIFMQDYPDFEVIVVDANSVDNTEKIIYQEYNNIKKEISLVFMPVDTNTSIGKARQIGVDNSQGEVIAFIDSDVELPHQGWLNNMVQPLLYGCYSVPEFYVTYPKLIPAKAVAGVQTLAKCHENDPWILKHLHNSFEYKNKIISLNNYEMVGTGHCLIRKECIKEVGGFKDVNSFEDIGITRKIMETNLVFVYLPEEKVYHYHVTGIMQYIKKHIIRNKINAIRRILFE